MSLPPAGNRYPRRGSITRSRRLLSGLLERRGRPATGERLAHPQPEALKQLGNRLRPHLKAIALPELCERLLISLGHTTHVDELLEEALETGRRDDLEDPAGLVARVPERVPLVARLEDQVTRGPASTTSSPSSAPMRPLRTKLYSSSRVCRCSG